MAYRALYREWRPKDFSHVVGQNAIIDTLRNQVTSKRIAHAYLFCGSRGTGKTSTAKILAKAINCLNPHNGDPCGVCENCQRAENEGSLDTIEIDAASNNGVDEIRELRETVKYPPQYGEYKVYIIDEVHMLSPSAFNALLKTLEEPPAHIVFILATTEPQKLPETILSRCQRFDFGRIPIQQIAGRLKEASDASGANVTDGALMLIARAAEGGMRDALSILDMCLGYREQVDEALVRDILGTSEKSFLFEFCGAMADGDAAKVFNMIDKLMRNGKDPTVFAKDICSHIRSLMIAKLSPDDASKIMDITEEEAADLTRQGNEMSISRIMRFLDLFMSLETEMRWYSTPRLALENTALKCCIRIEGTDNQSLVDRISELEKQLDKLLSMVRNGSLPVQKNEFHDVIISDTAVKSEANISEEKKQSRSDMSSKSVWKELMNHLRKTDITLWSFLQLGNLISDHHHHYQWMALQKEGEQQYITILNKDDKKKTICSILNEVTGDECSFTAVAHDSVTKDDGSDEAYLASIYETFGKEPVNIVDEIK